MSAYKPYPSDAATTEARQTIADDARLASRWRRFWALMVDSLVLVVIVVLVAFVAVLLVDDDISDDGMTVLGMVVGLVLAFTYAPPLLARRGAHNGQTLGKQLLRVRVVTKEGVPVTYGRALQREVLGLSALNLLTGGLYALVDYPFGLFDKRRQCLHDKIGSTYVYRADVAQEAASQWPTPDPASAWPPPLQEQEQPPRVWEPVAPPAAESPQHVWAPPSAPQRPDPPTPPQRPTPPPPDNDAARKAFGE